MHQLPPPPFLPPPHMALINPELAPKETLYITNLNDKVKIEDMKYSLFFLFSQYGEILKIVIKKSNRMRGQAFVVFSNISSATNAKVALQDFRFFEKSIKIEFAHTRSLIFEQMDGNIFAKDHVVQPKKETKQNKRDIKTNLNNKQNQNLIIIDADINSVLIAEALPEQITEDALTELFNQYPGLRDLKLIAPRKLAFIEYDTDLHAQVALKGLNGFLLTKTDQLQIKYARKN